MEQNVVSFVKYISFFLHNKLCFLKTDEDKICYLKRLEGRVLIVPSGNEPFVIKHYISLVRPAKLHIMNHIASETATEREQQQQVPDYLLIIWVYEPKWAHTVNITSLNVSLTVH